MREHATTARRTQAEIVDRRSRAREEREHEVLEALRLSEIHDMVGSLENDLVRAPMISRGQEVGDPMVARRIAFGVDDRGADVQLFQRVGGRRLDPLLPLSSIES